MTLPRRCEVVVVGAGLAGLACARTLLRAGRDVHLLEAADAVGGRVRSDVVDGFVLDRGFQVLNTAYPEVKRIVDLEALRLHVLDSAVIVVQEGGTARLPNPLHDLRSAPSLLTSSLAGPMAKTLLGSYAARATVLPPSVLRRRDDVPGPEAWAAARIPVEVIEQVLVPFFTGVVLEREISTSRRFLDLMMRMFALGRSTLPHGGMQRLPEQLAAALPPDRLHLASPVREVSGERVRTEAGETRAGAVVVATDAWTAHRLVPALGDPPRANGVTTYYHVTDELPGASSSLVVDADRSSPVANSLVLSTAAPSYAPRGQVLVSTSVVHGRAGGAGVDEASVRARLGRLHGPGGAWELLSTVEVAHALPAMSAPHPMRRPLRVPGGAGALLVAGDHRDTSSIQGALVSGRRAAEAVLGVGPE